MASLARVLLAVGLLVVVDASPQLSPSHPLSDTHDNDTPQEETLAIEHGFAESQGTDEGSESVHVVEEDTETVPEEVLGTQNDDGTDEIMTTTTEGFHSDYNPGYSFGFGGHHVSDSDTFHEDAASAPSFPQHHGSLSDGPTFDTDRPSTYYAYTPVHD